MGARVSRGTCGPVFEVYWDVKGVQGRVDWSAGGVRFRFTRGEWETRAICFALRKKRLLSR